MASESVPVTLPLNAVIACPYRPGEVERERNLEVVREWWEPLGWPLLAEDSDGVFSRAAAINRAAGRFDWDVLIVTDCDCVLGTVEQAVRGVELARSSGQYVAPHDELRYLDPAETSRVWDGVTLAKTKPFKSVSRTWGGTFMIPRNVWDTVGGFDERFVGYGWEDCAFFWAASTLCGAQRLNGPLYHLEHQERSDYPGRLGNEAANRVLANGYRAAIGDSSAMREMIQQ